MRKRSLRQHSGFTLVDLAMVLASLALLIVVFLLLNPSQPNGRCRAARISCVNNLKQVGLAYRIWSNDHEDRFPWQLPLNKGGIVPDSTQVGSDFGELVHAFLAISNELTVPKILVCPSDTKQKATGFELAASIPFGGRGLRNSSANLTYMVGWDADETRPQTILSGDPNCTEALPAGDGRAGVSGTVKSYGIGSAGDGTLVQKGVKWNQSLHNGNGNLGMADGSVHQVSSAQLGAMLASGAGSTNALKGRWVVPQP